MKSRIDSTPSSFMNHEHPVHYLHMGSTILHQPYADKKGIHCAGDKFGYIVDWQITEKKSGSPMVNKTSH
jgi:hypothetical protein